MYCALPTGETSWQCSDALGRRRFCTQGTGFAVVPSKQPHLSAVADGVRVHGREGTAMQYRCVATSVEGLVQQVACCYLPHGYWFHVSGYIPEQKDPA